MVEENEKTFAREVILKSETDSFLSIYVVKEEDSLENGLCEDDTRGGESEEETVNESHSTEEKIDPNYSDEGESDREEIKETTQTNVNGHKSSEVDKVISEFMKLTCNLCSIETQTFANLRRHFTAVHKINSGYATCCQLRFRRRHMLYEHILHHKNPNIFTCEICGKRCKSTDKLKEHKKSHMSEEMKKFECLTCHMKFATNAKMKHHSLVHIPDDKKTEQCSKCDRKFANRALLNTHIRVIHDKIRNFVCEICAKPFLSLSSLTAHQIVHHDLKQSKIKCDHCGKMYSTASTLKSHIDRVKDSNKIHQCDKCNHISPNLKALKAHQSYSHKVDPVLYNCSICGRTFKKRTNLKVANLTFKKIILKNFLFAGTYVCAYRRKTVYLLLLSKRV